MINITIKYIFLLTLMAVLPVLSGCGDLRSAAGLERRSPDEFAVVRRAPLTVPPDFRLPNPAERSAELSNQPIDQARQILTGQSDTARGDSQLTGGERSLLGAAKATNMDPSIRQEIDELQVETSDQPVIEKLQFWRDSGRPPGKAIDPAVELKRIQGQSTQDEDTRDVGTESGDNVKKDGNTTTTPPLTAPIKTPGNS
jgi:hypothetical protein